MNPFDLIDRWCYAARTEWRYWGRIVFLVVVVVAVVVAFDLLIEGF